MAPDASTALVRRPAPTPAVTVACPLCRWSVTHRAASAAPEPPRVHAEAAGFAHLETAHHLARRHHAMVLVLCWAIPGFLAS